MKKFLAAVLAALTLCVGCLLAACTDEPSTPPKDPLTAAECFKDFVPCVYFKSSNKPQGYENKVYSGEHVSLSDLFKSENNIAAEQYSYFQIFTTEKAALIEVTSISFDIVTNNNCQVQFCLGYSASDTLYSDSVSVTAGTAATVTFSSLHKRWSTAEAGKSELKEGWLIGEATTYLKIELINKTDFLVEGYRIQNLRINFTV